MLNSSGESYQVKEFPAICETRRLIIVLILFIFLGLKSCSCYTKKNAFSVDKYLNCVLTKYMLSYMFRLKIPIVRTPVYKEILVVGM